MKTNQVRIGEVYHTRCGSERIYVTVVAEVNTYNPNKTSFIVMRNDNGTTLPKPRSAAQLAQDEECKVNHPYFSNGRI